MQKILEEDFVEENEEVIEVVIPQKSWITLRNICAKKGIHLNIKDGLMLVTDKKLDAYEVREILEA